MTGKAPLKQIFKGAFLILKAVGIAVYDPFL